VSGTNGISPGRSTARGRNGPANSRRISVAACALKISPGRIRTNAQLVMLLLQAVELTLDRDFVA
jgi:hypothetical protein